MNQEFRRLLSVTILLLIAEPALGIEPGDREATRALVRRGVERFEANDYSNARDDFMAALKEAEVPAIAFWAARAHEKLGDLVKAAELYRAATQMQQNELWADKATQQNAKRNAARALKAILPHVATLSFEIQNATLADLALTIDGNKVEDNALTTPRPFHPFEHSVTATTKDGRTLTVKVPLAEGEKKVVTLDLAQARAPEPAPKEGPLLLPPTPPVAVVTSPRGYIATHQPSRDNTQRTLAWAALGVGAAGLALGATTGIVTWVKYSSLTKDGCTSEMACPGNVSDGRIDSFNAWRNVPTPSLIVGGVAAAVGVTLLLIPQKEEASPQLSVTMGPSAVSVNGAL